MMYSREALDALIHMARQLGYLDDVAHWEREKKRIYGDDDDED